MTKQTASCIDRREFLRGLVVCGVALTVAPAPGGAPRKPNLVFLLADQWRAQATGYAGHDPNARTPRLDRLAAESVNFTNAISGTPVCCPYRASLLTGQYPLTHGVFLNDVPLGHDAPSIAHAYAGAGYKTAYIGKWHLDGRGRSNLTPPGKRRQGFDYWRALECTHNYNNSLYYADADVKLKWEGYDALAQTRDAQRYLRERARDREPFILFLSWGPPHAPYQTAPQKYRDRFTENDIKLPPNVPKKLEASARKDMAGYYAHIAALDDCVGDILDTLDSEKLAGDTILVFTSDHGDMLHSQGSQKKQQPWDESIRVPFLLRCPSRLGASARAIDMPINTPDIMPTLLGLSGVESPPTVEGHDYSGVARAADSPDNEAVLISCPSPFGQWTRAQGGREFRGVRTRRHTYVRSLDGPWLLYDNERDPYQLNNLVNTEECSALQKQLEESLVRLLLETKDDFLTGPELIKIWGYKIDKSGTVPYTS